MSFRLTYATMFNPPEDMHVQFEAALARLESQFGRRQPLFVDGGDRDPAGWSAKHNAEPALHPCRDRLGH